jgi:uncharacterized protein
LALFVCLVRGTGLHSPSRRKLLKQVSIVAAGVPVMTSGIAYIKRDELTFREVDVPIKGLPADLNGLRLVQLSDLHLSPLVSESLVARAVDMANETRAHLAIVTGDLITRRGDPLDACIGQIARLRAEAGVVGCLGNHETYTNSEEYVTETAARAGVRFLRSQAEPLKFGNSVLNVAGVDYQSRSKPYLRNAGKMIAPGATNILLSHNPDVFKVAASQGWDLTLAGHTHGGQINFEILHEGINVARLFTPYVYGLYEELGRSIFVTRGVGTIGLPARLGAPPEVALIRLCAI